VKQQFNKLPDIVARLAHFGSEQTYRELFDLLFLPAKNFAFCILHSNEEAEEVAQDMIVCRQSNLNFSLRSVFINSKLIHFSDISI